MSTDTRPTVNIKPCHLLCVRLRARAPSNETAGQWLSFKREDTGHTENCQAQQYAPSVFFVFPLTPPPWNARTHPPLHCKVHANQVAMSEARLSKWSGWIWHFFNIALSCLCIVSGAYQHAECPARVHQRVTCAVSASRPSVTCARRNAGAPA